ncbi:MAG TPA: class I SAM-dependent methyltransferase [Acidimicrobiia bacterium]|nr:class I SAM-dependent methyltransferase [Acidimicrobiia bacterium]
MVEIDLDRLAAGYAHRRTSEGARRRATATAEAAGLGPGSVALDVGGGRGDHAEVLAAAGARAVVVDRSPAMARAARERGLPAVVADGRCLPLREETADLVYFHLSLHYGGWEMMLAEAARVLRPGGMVAAWTFCREHFRHSLLARWFPSIAPIDEARFPDPDLIWARMWALRLEEVRQVAETEVVSRRAGDWEAAVRAGFISTLQLLDPAEIEAGLAGFHEEHPDPDEVLHYRLWYRGVMGRKPRR